MTDERGTESSTDQPFLRVVNADATAEEVAALVAVLAALGESEETQPVRPPAWNAPHRLVRMSHPHGPDGWRTSGLPR